MNPHRHKDEKKLLIVAACVAGVVMFMVLQPTSGTSFVFAIMLSLGAAFIYPVVGAGVVNFLRVFRKWAYLDDVEPMTEEEMLVRGAIWPLALVFCSILYT